MSLTYASLQQLLIERQEKTQQWQSDLFNQAVEFSEALKQKLAPPENPIQLPSGSDTWPPFQLSEPVVIDGQASLANPLTHSGFEKFIAKGALSFSIVLSFQETKPSCSIVCSCVVRFNEDKAKFGFGEAIEVVSNWYTLDDAVIAFQERIEAAYHTDSYARSDKPPVGFFHLQADSNC
ncbi:MAG: hypothetical protein AB8B97_10350 [Granulosicoccus sp.]